MERFASSWSRGANHEQRNPEPLTGHPSFTREVVVIVMALMVAMGVMAVVAVVVVMAVVVAMDVGGRGSDGRHR